MTIYLVYRLDYAHQTYKPVGKLVERRRYDRGQNMDDLLKLAEKTYPSSRPDSQLFLTPENKLRVYAPGRQVDHALSAFGDGTIRL
ncbi:MAG: hypothetical protein IH611_13275 [Deltaproteobacteria bacterium]|nr:hypothetical protein [Deltaproteobacteria bacterium]